MKILNPFFQQKENPLYSKTGLLILFLLFFLHPTYAHSHDDCEDESHLCKQNDSKNKPLTCGTYFFGDQDPNECPCTQYYKLDSNGKSVLTADYKWTDRFGNRYCNNSISGRCDDSTLPKQRAATPITDFCESEGGLFGLTFQDDGLSDIQKEIICQVFSDLEVLINPIVSISSGNGGLVNIHVQSYYDPEGNAVAAATPYESSTIGDGKRHDEVWRAINTNFNNPDQWDGRLRVNLGYPLYEDYQAIADGPAGLYGGLYSVILHEALHLLGIYSIIGHPASILDENRYSPFFELIETEVNGISTSMITTEAFPSPNPNPYNWNFTFDVASGVYTSSICDNIKFKGNGLDVPIHAPNEWTISSFDHFDICDSEDPNDQYAIAPGSILGTNFSRRITPAEVETLCALGFQTTGIYGTTSVTSLEDCTTIIPNPNYNNTFSQCGNLLSAMDDLNLHDNLGFDLQSCPENAYFILLNTITDNDLFNSNSNFSVPALEDTSEDGEFLFLTTNDDGEKGFELISPEAGNHTYRYRLEERDEQGNLIESSNFAYVTLFITPCSGFGCTNTNPCNLVCNPHMENIDNQCTQIAGFCLATFGIQCAGQSDGIIGWNASFGNPSFNFTGPACTSANNLLNPNFLAFDTGGSIGARTFLDQGSGFITNVDVYSDNNYLLSFFRSNLWNIHSPGYLQSEGYDISLTNTANSNSLTVLNESNPILGLDWGQEIVSFSLDNAADFNSITFETFSANLPNTNFQSGVQFDRIELIEDKMNQVQASYDIVCGNSLTVGMELCDVTSLQYQWWDVTNVPAVQITAGNEIVPGFNSSSYIVSEVYGNGSSLNLDNIVTNVTLELRRVFIWDNTLLGPSIAINNNNAGSTAQVIINMPDELLNPEFSYTFLDCNTISFLANETIGYHQWDFNNDGIIDLEGSDLYNPIWEFSLTEEFYDIVHTINNVCGAATETQTIHFPTDPSFDFNTDLSMGCNYIEFISNYSDENTIHLWEFDNGLPSIAGNSNPSLNYFPAGIDVTVTHTITSDCGESQESMVVNIPPCELPEACSASGLIINYHIGSSSVGGLSNFSSLELSNDINGYNFYVEGDLLMDYGAQGNANTLLFEECDFIMGTAASITIEDERYVKFLECDFSECDFMWKGIKGGEEGKLTLFKNNIRGAEYALTIVENSRTQLFGNIFNANYISIYNEPLDNSANLIDILSFRTRNNQFLGDLALPQPYPSSDIYDSYNNGEITNPFAGIKLSNINSFTIGFPNNNPNQNLRDLFKNLTFGIHLYKNGNVTVEQCKFEDSEHGIHAVGEASSSLTQIGLGNTSPLVETNEESTFLNTQFPIQTFKIGALESSQNIIRNAYTGIQSTNTAMNVNLYNNTIFTRDFGIEIADEGADVSINNNGIFLDNGLPNDNSVLVDIGISSHSSSVFGGVKSIDGNNIHFLDVQPGVDNAIGIEIINASNSNISENYISIVGSALTSAGIWQEGGSLNIINCNKVEGSSPNDNSTAIHIQSSNHGRFECNSTDRTTSGMTIIGACYHATIAGNEFNNHLYGLIYESTAVTDVQDNHTNKFLGDFTFFDAANANANGISDSKFLVVGTEFPHFPNNYAPISPSWFGQSSDETPSIYCGNESIENNCHTFNPLENMRLSSSNFSQLDQKIALGKILSLDYQEEILWTLQKSLFEKISESNQSELTPELLKFYEDKNKETVGQFVMIEKARKNFYLRDKEIRSKMTDLLAYNQSLSKEMSDLQLSSTTSQLSIEKSALESQIKSLSNQIKENMEEWREINDRYWLKKEADAAWILQQNSKITASEVYELNEKKVNEILAYTFDQGIYELTPVQQNEIISIAEQCPLSGGKSVYRARSIRSTFDNYSVYNDDLNCEKSASVFTMASQEENQSLTEEGTVTIFPNPAKNFLNIKSENEDVTIIFRNILGKEVTRINITSGSVNIQVNDWTQGVYLAEIIDKNDNSVETIKILIH